MKLPSSSESSPFSSCSSSTTTTTFDVTKSKGTTSSNGCIVGILRRLLGFGNLPTYPFDHIAEDIDQPQNDREFKPKAKTEEETESSATPNLVARLMGLESIPEANLTSVSRSRSMNYMNRRLPGDHDSTHDHECRRVKSFREMPTFLENEEFLILSFENGSENRARRSKGRKCQTGNGEMRSKKAGKSRNKENRIEIQLEKDNKQIEKSRRRALKDLNRKETTLRSKTFCHKPKKETICDVLKDVESDCISEDLSPVSVLDCSQFLVDIEVPTSEEDSVLASSFPSRKDDCLTCDARKINTIEGKCLGSKKKVCHTAEYFDILDEICKLTEEELVGSNWFVHKNMWSNDEVSAEIAADFESKVLGQLIEELVDQMC